MPRTSNRVEAAEGKARGIGPYRADALRAQAATRRRLRSKRLTERG